jgi:acetyl-CoA carboxylase biotin carboxyl carrier protein
LTKVLTEVSGNVWKIEVSVGQAVSEGDALVVVESMKMEIPVEAPRSGVVAQILVREGEAVSEGAAVAVLA